MQKATPKPYLELSGSTILEYTIRRFLPLGGLSQVIVATSEEYLNKAKQILTDVLPQSVTGCCLAGGAERQDSIRNALAEVGDIDLVMVHDAVRPFIKLPHIQKSCEIALDVGGAVVGVPAKDTIKRIDEEQIIQETPSRKFLWQTQTPQVFRKSIILEAYKRAEEDNFTGTDDSSLVERLGYEVKMVEGDRSNFKITFPLDLELAQLLISKESN